MNQIISNKRGLSATTKNLIYNNYNMDKYNLSSLTKDQLINLLLKQNTKIQLLKNKLQKPVPAPRKNVKQMVQDYEENIIPPPIEFQDKPSPSLGRSKDQFLLLVV